MDVETNMTGSDVLSVMLVLTFRPFHMHTGADDGWIGRK